MVLKSGMATAITAPIPVHQASAPMSLMSCVRESSPPLHLDSCTDQEIDKNESSKKRRFHPFRGLRKMFRRKVRHSGDDEITTGVEMPTPESETPNIDSHRSRSTSELLAGDEPTRRKSGTSGFYSGHGGLSVSHDSVFTGDPHSSSDLELDTAQSSSSLSIQQLVLPGVRAELLDAVRRRRTRGDTSEDDEDLGLPRSPCNSPITTDTLLEKAVKEHTTKSHSTCSDGSLLSMDSSEMDDDSFGLHSRHSSKVSLHEKKPPTSISLETESGLDLGDIGSLTAPLSHSAARHKMSVRPKRTHGAPRRRRVQQITSGTALPTTPEVNEETVRSASPEITKQDTRIPKLSTTPGIIIPSETRLKSSSLPPGLALSSAIAASAHHLSRSRSNAAGAVAVSPLVPRSMSHDKQLHKNAQRFDEEDEIIEKKKEESFFGRLLSRRSGKKKKEKGDEIIVSSKKESIFNAMNVKKRMDEKGRYSSDDIHYTKNKSGPASRQRVDPIDLPPASPDLKYKTPPMDIPRSPPPFKLEPLHKLPPTGLVKTPTPPSYECDKITPPMRVNSPERTTLIDYLPRQKRMDAYNKILDTSSKIVNEEIANEKLITAEHPRQRKIESLVEPPPIEENKIEPIITYSSNSLNKTMEKKSRVTISGVPPHQHRSQFEENTEITDKTEFGFTSLNHIYNDCMQMSTSRSQLVIKSHSFKHNNNVVVNRYNRQTKEYNLPPSLPTVHNDISECDGFNLRVQIKKSSSLDSIKSNRKSPPPGDTLKSVSVESVSSTKIPPTTDINSTMFQVSPHKNIETPIQSTVTISCNNNIKSIKSEQHVVTLSVTQTEKVEEDKPEPSFPQTVTQPTVKMAVNKKPIVKEIPKLSPTISSSPQVPEFLKIQLNKVDAKPTTNIVLSTNMKDTKILERKSINEEPVETIKKVVAHIDTKNNVESCNRKMSSEPSTPTEINSSGDQTTFWKLNGSLKPKRQSSISLTPVPSSGTAMLSFTTPSSPIVTKPFISQKSASLEVIDVSKKILKKDEDKNNDVLKKPQDEHMVVLRKKSSGVHSSTSSLIGSTGSISCEENIVVLRKKSMPNSTRSDEPELMKVFARRSLKLNTDGENLSQQVLVMLENIDKASEVEENNSKNIVKSRDSDKENEDDIEIITSNELTYKQHSSIRLSHSTSKFPVITRNSIIQNDANKDCKKNEINKVDNKNLWPTVGAKKSSGVSNVVDSLEIDTKKNNIDIIPKFKRIQQRKEEWEQRAQQALKKSAVP